MPKPIKAAGNIKFRLSSYFVISKDVGKIFENIALCLKGGVTKSSNKFNCLAGLVTIVFRFEKA